MDKEKKIINGKRKLSRMQDGDRSSNSVYNIIIISI